MRRLVAASLLLVSFLASNVWLLELCDHALEADCCRDGMCPIHHHIQSDDNCACHLSPIDHQSMMISVAVPAIMPVGIWIPRTETQDLADGSTSYPASIDRLPATPPPKA
jgi:hypothetical protein